MRKVYLLIALGFILTLNTEAKKIKGKILFQNDTIDVIFIIPFKFFDQEPNYVTLQNKVQYLDSKGENVILRPNQAKEIRFKYGDEEIRMLSRFNSLDLGDLLPRNDYIFLKLELDGNLKLFSYYYPQYSTGMYSAATNSMSMGYSFNEEKYILQKGNGELKKPVRLKFKKDIIEYIADCPALVQKIESKEFRNYDLEFIVQFYNSNCK